MTKATRKECVVSMGNDLSIPELIWIDDCFDNRELPDNEFLDFDFINAYFNAPHLYPDNDPNLQILLTIKTLCESNGICFSIANFEYLEDVITAKTKLTNEYFLIDVNYTGKEQGEFYGIQLLLGWTESIFTDRICFFSSYSDRVVAATRYGIPREQIIFKDIDNINIHLACWLKKIVWHDDLYISKALSFYSLPWINENIFPGKWHSGSVHDNIIFTHKLADWLNLSKSDIDMNSSKSLLIWVPEKNYFGDWFSQNNTERQRGGYPILGKVLIQVMQNLNVTIEGIDELSRYYMPLDPSIRFLMCLRLFSCKVQDTQSPTIRLICHKSNIDYDVYQVVIKCKVKDWELRNRFYNRESRGNGLAQDIDQILIKWDIGLPKKHNNTWQDLFTYELTYPPYSFYLTPGLINIFWTNLKV